ncbi:MAG: hypothetical protein LBI72_13760 [Flavobacteriaceae bacterium]|jgi:hypothetical protein|nr:hypothetical protein [Flavobacteriaceae bacterium]
MKKTLMYILIVCFFVSCGTISIENVTSESNQEVIVFEPFFQENDSIGLLHFIYPQELKFSNHYLYKTIDSPFICPESRGCFLTIIENKNKMLTIAEAGTNIREFVVGNKLDIYIFDTIEISQSDWESLDKGVEKTAIKSINTPTSTGGLKVLFTYKNGYVLKGNRFQNFMSNISAKDILSSKMKFGCSKEIKMVSKEWDSTLIEVNVL